MKTKRDKPSLADLLTQASKVIGDHAAELRRAHTVDNLWPKGGESVQREWAKLATLERKLRVAAAEAGGMPEPAEFKDCGCAAGTCDLGPEACPYSFGASEVDREAALWREHSPKWAASLNRRATVEQWMFDAASGKHAMPTQQELREWALKLGTPEDDELRAAIGVDSPRGGQHG